MGDSTWNTGVQRLFTIAPVLILLLQFELGAVTIGSPVSETAGQNNGMVEAETTRDLLDLPPSNINHDDAQQMRLKRKPIGEDPGTADSPNEIAIDLSNPDYLRDYHHGTRRVKKVLPSDNKASVEDLSHTNLDIFGNPLRPKRFVEVAEKLLGIHVPYLSLGKETVSRIMLADSTEEQQVISTDSFEKTTPRSKSNITGLEFKLFQNTLIAALASFCPKLKAEYSILLDAVQHSVKNEIRAANSLLPRKPSKNNKLFLLMKKISKCSQGATTKLQHQKNQDNLKTAINPSKPKINKYAMIRQYLEREGKRLARLSQKDVIPSIPNIVKLFSIILEKIAKNCPEFEDDLVSESQRTSDLLFALIQLEKDSQYGKKPTLHQRDMEKLIDGSKFCEHETSQVSKV